MEKETFASGGAVYILLLVILALIPLLWLSIFGFQTQNLQALAIGMIFIVFILVTFAFDFYKNIMPSSATYGQAALAFTIGFILAVIINWGKTTQSVFGIFAIPQNQLLSSISGQLPIFWERFVNIIGAGVSEELMFLITIPTLIFIILRFAKIEDEWVQIGVAAAITSVLFAVFHVGNLAFMGFIISAVIFRTFLIGMVYGDKFLNLVPFLTILPSFAISFHIGNNTMSYGLFETLGIFMAEPLGWIVLAFLFTSFAIGGNYAIRKVIK